jgi:hypothetical protein
VLQECYLARCATQSVDGGQVPEGCYRGVTGMLQECYKSVTRVLQECYKSVTRVLQACYKGVTRV